ncbi:MAG TPA: glycosyltransferase family A protein [Niallia sp.]|nr:glycosyltransferase family A protein [Niallia sp.]
MSVYENTLLITLLFIGVLSILSSYLMLWKLPLIKKVDVKNIPYVQPMISIIIPARNEERTIENLLSSLKNQQYPHYEVIVVDDESIDKTAEVAKCYGAKVIHQGKKKWKGKSAACWNGAKVARGDLFLFLDADTRLDHSKALASMVDFYQKKGRTGLLSIQPYHVVQSIYENFSVLFNIMVITGMNVFTIWKERFQSGGSFGPCILTSREDYFFSGGHKQVADAVMDGIELGKGYRRKGLPVSCLGGKGTINFRMYPNGGGRS